MPTKKQFAKLTIIAMLGLISLGLGYWYGLLKEGSPEKKAEVSEPEPPTFTSDPNNADNVKIEAAIRKAANKPTGELTEADSEKVTRLVLGSQLTDIIALAGLTELTHLDLRGANQLTDISALAGLTKLTGLALQENPGLTKTQIADLEKAGPTTCLILSNPKK